MYYFKEFVLIDKEKSQPIESQAFPKQNNHRSFSTRADIDLWNV